MSLTPASPRPDGLPQKPTWQARLTRISFALFCLEVGLFLLLLPWTPYWDANLLSSLPLWRDVWSSGFLRGAVSGLGLLNLYLAVAEMSRK